MKLSKTKNALSLRDRGKKNKLKLITAFGGKCKVCSYDKLMDCLEFHHMDPTTKSFGISRKYGCRYEKLFEEALKCILVCNRCHKEIEAGITIIPGMSHSIPKYTM